MNIPIRVTKEGAANWTEHAVEMDREPTEWKDADLYQLCDRMQWHTGGTDPIRTRERVGDGYVVAVAVKGMKAETIAPLPLSAALASSSIWKEPGR
jgi:hypothetical protein